MFTRVAINPEDLIWVGEIERGDADPIRFAEVLNILAAGLPGIGKTQATATVSFNLPEPRLDPRPLKVTPAGHQVWRIVLETDALLHGPGDVFKHEDQLDPVDRLNRQYRDYFAAAINDRTGQVVATADDLQLSAFATQRWVGGYLARRYPAYSDRYYPHLLTEAGSTFFLTTPPDTSPAVVSFATAGLPLPPSVPDEPMQHERSPFIPQNGYGEVSIEAAYFPDTAT